MLVWQAAACHLQRNGHLRALISDDVNKLAREGRDLCPEPRENTTTLIAAMYRESHFVKSVWYIYLILFVSVLRSAITAVTILPRRFESKPTTLSASEKHTKKERSHSAAKLLVWLETDKNANKKTNKQTSKRRLKSFVPPACGVWRATTATVSGLESRANDRSSIGKLRVREMSARWRVLSWLVV
jgi:hypothetical protein